jgi:hypothetical protein
MFRTVSLMARLCTLDLILLGSRTLTCNIDARIPDSSDLKWIKLYLQCRILRSNTEMNITSHTELKIITSFQPHEAEHL